MLNRTCLLLLIALTFPVCAAAGNTYDQSPFAINGLKLAHASASPSAFDDARKTARAMKDAGIYWDRLEIWWGSVEPEKGKWDWSFADKVAGLYREQGINGLLQLSYSSSWSKKPPADPAERAAFANYVYQLVSRYKDTFKVYEVWNEPNIGDFWPEPNVRDYTLLLKEAYEAAKKADPTCTVLAAATSGPDLTFIRGIAANGGLDYCDGISIHPYSLAGDPISQKLDTILRMDNAFLASTGKRKPLWITEMGWTTDGKGMMDKQAIYMFQSYIIALANGVEKLFWFDLADWQEKWGIVKSTDPLQPKPAYSTYKLMTSALGSPGRCARFEGWLRMPEGVACYAFRRSSRERILVLWSSDGRARCIRFGQRAGLSAVDIFGKQAIIEGGVVAVGPTPVIVSRADVNELGDISRAHNPYLEQKGQNLLNNGSLDVQESGHPKSWFVGRADGSAKDGALATADDGQHGSKCISFSGTGDRAAYDATPIPVEPGKKYRLTAWVRTKDATGKNQVGLFWYTGSMWGYLSEARSETVTGTRDWTEISVAATAPKDATFVRANLISDRNSGTTWFDDVELVAE